MTIGISRCSSKFEKYTAWLDYFKVNYIVLDYENHSEDLEKFDGCSGLILTGGVDIYPELYCDWDTRETRGTYSPERDGFELQLIEKAMKRKIPLYAICRGMQLVNVYFRGNLIFDLEEIRKVNHSRISKTEDRFHEVKIQEDTLLRQIIGESELTVTSSHHQAVDRLGEGLILNAKSPDGITEGIEYAEKTDKPFFIGIQWHPERFSDYELPASKNILEKFISEANKILIG